MEIVETENIKVPNSLIISGLSYTPADEEIFDYVKQYGSEFYEQAIVEFESDEAIQALEDILPLDKPSDEDPKIIHHVKTLASVYSSKAGTESTQAFLSKLKGIAKLSGRTFEDILHEELTRITETMAEQTLVEQGEAVEEPSSIPPPSGKMVTPSQTTGTQPSLHPGELNPTSVESQSHTRPAAALASTGVRGESMHNFNLPPDHFCTPEVQRVVVEHIVKSTEMASQLHSPAKLRSFSGRVPCPNYEVDYDDWRTSVGFYLTDPTVSYSQLVRRIVDSLLPPPRS